MTGTQRTATADDPACLVLIGPPGLPDAAVHPVGCGLLVQAGPQPLVLTCAHVVNAALNRAKTVAETPVGKVGVRAWTAAEQEWVAAEVVADGWVPVDAAGAGDMAVLQLTGPLPGPVAEAPLARWTGRAGYQFQCLGFPTGYHQRGQHATGKMIGRFGPGGRFGPEWVQLNGQTSTGYRVVQGFSGSPVWDLADQQTVGLVVGEDVANPAARVGAMIPLEIVAGYLPVVADRLPSNAALAGAGRRCPPELTISQLSELVDALLKLPTMKDASRRRNIIAQLRPEIGNRIEDDAAARPHVVRIVRTCGQYSDGLQELIDILELNEGNPPQLTDVREVAARLCGQRRLGAS